MTKIPASQKDFRLINGHSLYIESYGITTGALIVLIHHGLSELRNRTFIPKFLDDIEDLRTLAEILGAAQLALIGHSDGGTIACYFAARFPARVTSRTTRDVQPTDG